MSRSYKHQPFMAICGGGSAKHDKALAHRGIRQANRSAIINAAKQQDFQDFLAPHKFECSWNDTYCWGRDGNQIYQALSAQDRSRYLESEPDGQWPPDWYIRMMRK